MSYQVIARKYRPQRFEDVVGQEHVTQTLANAIRQNRIAHAYLFVGPRGTGKTTVARIFAKCLNCTAGPSVEFSDDDPRVKEITDGRSLDVLEIDGASNRGIDEVRELRETVKYAPANGRFKIYIIDEVHMLTKEAFNALLKTLEEPPAHVKFMFATTEPEKVLPTILSRCQRFDLRRIPSALIVKHLAKIAAEEKVQIEPAALQAIARGADGGMRDAESTLDQLISFCGKQIAESDVLSMFGLAAQGQILELSESIIAGETERALRLLDGLAHQGKDLGRLVSELLNRFRNLLIFKVSGGDLSLLEASEAEGLLLSEQATQVGFDALTRMMELLTDCEARLRDTASKKILIEVTLLKLIEARHAVSIDSVLKHLQELRGGSCAAPKSVPVESVPTASIKRTAAPPPPSSVESPAAVVPVAPTQVASVPAAEGELSQLWEKLVSAVGRASPFVRNYFENARPVSLSKNLLTIAFEPDHIALIDNSKNHNLVQSKLVEMGLGHVQVKFIQGEASKPAVQLDPPAPPPQVERVPEPQAAARQPSPAPKAEAKSAGAQPEPSTPSAPPKPKSESVPFNKDDFKNDPLIQKALEIFKGQIIDVRS